MKYWIKNTTEKGLAKEATKVLESDKEEVLTMVANNAFILKEMEEEAKQRGLKEGIKEGRQEERKLTKKVFKLFIAGIKVEDIADECNISIEEVQKILE